MVTDVPAETPFKSHVSHGKKFGLTPPVPLPEMDEVTERTAETELVVNSNIASDAMNAEIKDREVNLTADERRERRDATPRIKLLFPARFTTNSAQKLYVHNVTKRQCEQGFPRSSTSEN